VQRVNEILAHAGPDPIPSAVDMRIATQFKGLIPE
jgi:hypothetical protein